MYFSSYDWWEDPNDGHTVELIDKTVNEKQSNNNAEYPTLEDIVDIVDDNNVKRRIRHRHLSYDDSSSRYVMQMIKRRHNCVEICNELSAEEQPIPDSNRVKYINFIMTFAQLFCLVYVGGMVGLHHCIQRMNIVNTINDGHKKLAITTNNNNNYSDNNSLDHVYRKKIDGIQCRAQIVNRSDYLSYIFIIIEPFVSFDTMKIWFYHLEFFILLMTVGQSQALRMRRHKLVGRCLDIMTIFDSGFDELIDDCLHVLCDKTINDIRTKVDKLQELITGSYKDIPCLRMLIKRFYPVIKSTPIQNGRRKSNKNNCLRKQIVKELPTYSKIVYNSNYGSTATTIGILPRYCSSRQPSCLKEIAMRMLVYGTFILFSLIYILGNITYPFFQTNQCVDDLNFLTRATLMILKLFVINSYVLSIGVSICVYLVFVICTMIMTIEQIRLIQKAMYQCQCQITIENALRYKSKNHHHQQKRQHGSADDTDESDVDLIVTNLLRINNYIIWKTECFDVIVRTGTTCCFIWLIISVIIIFTYFIRYFHEMNTFEMHVCSQLILGYIVLVAVFFLAAILNKEVRIQFE